VLTTGKTSSSFSSSAILNETKQTSKQKPAAQRSKAKQCKAKQSTEKK